MSRTLDEALKRKKAGDPNWDSELKSVGDAQARGVTAYSNAQVDPRLAGLTGWMKAQREGDIKGGMDFASMYFGANNPEMKAILDARREAAFGADRETALAREAGTENINRSVQTALRQFQGRLPGTGVRGGAAGAMAGMMTRDAVSQTRGLERDLALNEMARKREALANYESSLTGERAGLLGTGFAHAGMGSQDRWGGMQYLNGMDFLNEARNGMPGPGGGQSPVSAIGGAISPTSHGRLPKFKMPSNPLPGMSAGFGGKPW